MVHFARCCQPIPGDQIMGLITRGRGVSVHRMGCTNLNDPNLDEGRLIEVVWDAAPDQTFMVKLILMASDRQNLLADVSNAISAEGANIISGEFVTEDAMARATVVIAVRSLNALERILTAVTKITGVERIERFQS